MSARHDQVRRAIATPLRLRMALGLVPGLPARALPAFEAWIEADAMDDDERARRRPRSGLSTTADLASATCRTTIDAPDAADYLIARFEGVTGDDELALIEAVVDRVEPARVGHFLEASGDALDRGWSVPVEMPLGRALAMTPPNAVVERLLGFAERQGLDRCTRWSRSVGAGNPFTELVVPLPGPARAALELGLAAPGELRAPPLPAAVRDALGALAVDGVALSVWLTRGGMSKLGLVGPGPGTVDVLRLCAAVGATELDPLAAIEGALGVDGPATAEAAVFADRVAVQLDYELAATDGPPPAG